MLKQLKRIFSPGHTQTWLDTYYPVLRKIRARESELRSLPDTALHAQSWKIRERSRAGSLLNELIVDVYALVSETAYRVLHMRPYDVQIIAALALCGGKVAEMQTGEGKTLAATMPACLYALSGRRVHIHTFNDYLARRDAAWMRPVYDFLGIPVACIQEGMTQAGRREAYRHDIVYLTAKEGGFDYLRTFLVRHPDEIVQPRADLAIVDEVDSLLIDEARIPLVIAGETNTSKPVDLHQVAAVVKQLRWGLDFQTDAYAMNVFLTDHGISKVERALSCDNLYAPAHKELLVRINQSLHVHRLLRRDIDYIVNDGRIELVDEFTGRVVDNRKWPHGLQAALEAKEGITIQPEGKVLGKTTLQHFFGTYPVLCGMTGTARSAAEEFAGMYGMPVVVIPPNKPNRRIDHPDLLFPTRELKNRALTEEIRKVHRTGRPILVGTASVKESEALAGALLRQGIACRILNARNDEEEAAIVAQAGMMGAITISTNMAGRGTDIKLGGAEGIERERIIQLGGLYVIGTNRFESQRIDNQLRGRSGRQGDPGESRFFTSLKDDLLLKHGINDLLPKKYRHMPRLSPINSEIVNREVNRTQRIIEGKNFDIRKTLWRYASFIEMQRKVVHQLRQQALDGTLESIVLLRDEAFYRDLAAQHGEPAVRKAECQLTMAVIDSCWMDYLEEVDLVRQSIHLVALGGMNPFREFQKGMHAAFTDLLDRIDDEIVAKMKTVSITAEGIDLEKEGLLGPSSTWTYLVNDNPFGDRFSMMLNAGSNIGFAAGAALMWPLLTLYYVVRNGFGMKNNERMSE